MTKIEELRRDMKLYHDDVATTFNELIKVIDATCEAITILQNYVANLGEKLIEEKITPKKEKNDVIDIKNDKSLYI